MLLSIFSPPHKQKIQKYKKIKKYLKKIKIISVKIMHQNALEIVKD
jgi:hypothetical protein